MKDKLRYTCFLLLGILVTTIVLGNSLPFPVSEKIIQRKGYFVCYDFKNRQPRWVYEHLTEKSLQRNASREGIEFKEDSLVPQIFQAKNSDYKNSGYDRGHVVPAGDLKDNQEAMEESFYLSNISPQTPDFNRGYWLKLERHVRELLKQYKELHVYSGGLYVAQEENDGKRCVKYRVIGANNVAVATHFFKLIFSAKEGELTEAYIMPNEKIDLDQSLESFRVTLEKVERVAGIVFSKS